MVSSRRVCTQAGLHAAPNGKQYWHHKGTGKSEWSEPKEYRQYREATSVDGWTVHPAPNGLPYWYNEKTKESVWVEPPSMKHRRLEYATHQESVRELELLSPTKKRKGSSLSAFTTPAATQLSTKVIDSKQVPKMKALKAAAHRHAPSKRRACPSTAPSALCRN